VQEFVATYKVKVDEDGVRRLQSALEENRDTAESLASSFTAARGALASLKKEMSAPMSDYNFLGSHWTDQFKFPSLSGVMDGLSLPALKVDLDTSAAGEALSSFREQAEGMKPKYRWTRPASGQQSPPRFPPPGPCSPPSPFPCRSRRPSTHLP